MSIKIKMTCLALTCLLLLASACTPISTLYHGRTVSEVSVAALQEGGPVADRWETFDLVIDYKYFKQGDSFEISGQVALSQHYQITYDRLSRIYVYLFFLDKDSRVLETISFANTWSSNTDEAQDFSDSYTLPSGTAEISFGYTGVVRDEDSFDQFYALPLE